MDTDQRDPILVAVRGYLWGRLHAMGIPLVVMFGERSTGSSIHLELKVRCFDGRLITLEHGSPLPETDVEAEDVMSQGAWDAIEGWIHATCNNICDEVIMKSTEDVPDIENMNDEAFGDLLKKYVKQRLSLVVAKYACTVRKDRLFKIGLFGLSLKVFDSGPECYMEIARASHSVDDGIEYVSSGVEIDVEKSLTGLSRLRLCIDGVLSHFMRLKSVCLNNYSMNGFRFPTRGRCNNSITFGNDTNWITRVYSIWYINGVRSVWANLPDNETMPFMILVSHTISRHMTPGWWLMQGIDAEIERVMLETCKCMEDSCGLSRYVPREGEEFAESRGVYIGHERSVQGTKMFRIVNANTGRGVICPIDITYSPSSFIVMVLSVAGVKERNKGCLSHNYEKLPVWWETRFI